jgi:hypothetical protein
VTERHRELLDGRRQMLDLHIDSGKVLRWMVGGAPLFPSLQ